MISIVVPIYNTQDYLAKCIDSLLNQTYKDLDIILVDDGSTDRSPLMCDEYAKKDPRIRAFHTPNQGLSGARNFGIEQALICGGEYIGFIDSDDWIDSDMYESLISLINETNANVVGCSIYREFPEKQEIWKIPDAVYSGKEAARAIICGILSNSCCDKLWNIDIWRSNRFPQGRVMEDYATIYKIIETLGKIVVSSKPGYHYLCRQGSILQSHDLNLLISYWMASKERYYHFIDFADEATKKVLLYELAYSSGRMWSWAWIYRKEINDKYNELYEEASRMNKEIFPFFGTSDLGIKTRLGVLFARHNNKFSYLCTYLINQVRRQFK